MDAGKPNRARLHQQRFAAYVGSAMSANTLIEEFLNYLRFERHFSPHTAKCYAADLHQFCGFLQDGGASAPVSSGGYDSDAHEGGGGVATAVAAPPQRAQTTTREQLVAVEAEDVRRFLAFPPGPGVLQEYDRSQACDAAELLQVLPEAFLRRRQSAVGDPDAEAGQAAA